MVKQLVRLRNQAANTLAMVVVCIAIVAVLVAFFAINFSQVTGLHKEAQTAIDAAALQAAKDMSRVVVDGPVGRLALVDDSAGTNAYPIQSVNKVLGALRLDALIAHKLNNKTILFLVKNDLDQVKTAVGQLKQKITSSASGQGGAYDKNGQAINIRQNALDAYMQNSRRLGNTGEAPDNFEVAIGGITSGSDLNKSGISVPVPESIDPLAFDSANSYFDKTGQRYYKSDVALPIPGLSATIKLGALAQEPGLIDNKNFKDTIANDEVSVAVQVTGDEKVKKLASSASENNNTNSAKSAPSVRVMATAQCGGRSLMPPSGTLVVSYPAGFPTNPKGGSTPQLSFNSVQGIMNASQLDASAASPTSPYSHWNGASKGNWFKTKNGPVPGNGSSVAEPFKGISGRKEDDPSVCLSFLVYDWLRSLSLRPNAQSVINALSFDYKAHYATGGSTPTQFTASSMLIQPAYAAPDTVQGVASALLNLSDTGESDPRNMLKWNDNPQAYQRQQARMWGYVPADAILPAQAALVQITPDGSVLSMNGQPVSIIHEIQNHITFTNRYGIQVYDNVTEIMSGIEKEKSANDEALRELKNKRNSANAAEVDKAIEDRKIKIREEIFKENPRLAGAYMNAYQCLRTTHAMQNNLKVLTGGGVLKINDKHYRLMDTDFYPATHGASVAEILGTDVITTGQDPEAPVRDWCAVPVKVGKDAQSPLLFFKRTQEPIIGRATTQDSRWMQPALAQGTIPPNNLLKFIFKINGGAEQMGSGIVELRPVPTSPFSNVPTIEGQAHYQNVSAISVPAANDPNQEIQWQVQARDLNANAYPAGSTNANSQPNPGAAAQHYSGFSAPNYNNQWCNPSGNQVCPSLAAEFALTCPIPPPPPPPPPPPARSVPPPPPCGSWTGQTTTIFMGYMWTPWGMIPQYSCALVVTCYPPQPYHS